MTGSPGEFDMRLSQLPPWAQKQMLSRPSVAKTVSSQAAVVGGGGAGPARTAAVGESAPLEGKWAQVGVSVCVCV